MIDSAQACTPALLNNGQKLLEDGNPFGPQMIAQAFRDALAPCPFTLRIKVILYALFDSHVMQSLEALYGALNQRLIDAGVLPNLKYSAPRNTNPVPRSTPAPAAPVTASSPGTSATTESAASSSQTRESRTGKHGATPLDLNGPPPSDPDNLLDGLAQLLGEHRQRNRDAPLLGGTRSIASFASRDATRTYSAAELLEALNRMQRASADELTSACTARSRSRR